MSSQTDWQAGILSHYAHQTLTVFELLEPYICLDATKDPSARHPPPSCYPGTREKIRERLMRWLVSECDEWKMLWVRGYAGTGKSAVAQSFADSCETQGIFGGSYFFFRAAGITNPNTVVPTLIYQLAENVPEYLSFLEGRLGKNLSLLKSSPPVQFRKLIVEPFAALQRQSPRKPIVIILDGLDECKGGDAQEEILQMITDAALKYPNLPLRWLIFSRPEAHLKRAFSRSLLWGREELIIDAECRDDVERHVKETLVQIQDKYKEVIPADWPPRKKLRDLLDAVSGLFILASTCLNFIADRDAANPPSQLDSLLTFMCDSQNVISRSPLAALDYLYFQVLEKIQPTVYKTTRQILAYMAHQKKLDKDEYLCSAQTLSNFFRLKQQDFYVAVRGLHSVMPVPEPEDAKSRLQFYHATFQEFLINPNRSGRFSTNEQDALQVLVQSSIHWCEVDATHFHSRDRWDANRTHRHGYLPGLTWASGDNQLSLSQTIIKYFQFGLFHSDFKMQLNVLDESLLQVFQLSHVDFRYWYPRLVFPFALLCQLDPSTSVVRVEPSSPTDRQLLENFYLVIANGISKPAKFPLRRYLPDDEWVREYLFLGYGDKSLIVWRTKSTTSIVEYALSLCYGQEPSQAQISKYQEYLRRIQWDEARAKLEMK